MNKLASFFFEFFLKTGDNTAALFCISFASAQDPRELAVSPWEWTGHLNVRDNAAEIFTLANEQFLILPEGRFSPGCCGEEERRAPATERLSTLRQLDPLEIPPFFIFFILSGEEDVGARSGTGKGRARGSPRGVWAKQPHPIWGQPCLQAACQAAVPLL